MSNQEAKKRIEQMYAHKQELIAKFMSTGDQRFLQEVKRLNKVLGHA